MSMETGQGRAILPRGTVLDDRFELVELLGSGAFGDVYRAKQVILGRKLREVALKLFDPDKVTLDNMLKVFDEAILLIGLQEESPSTTVSRHLIQVYDMGVFKTPRPSAFVSMKLIPGRKTLGSAVRRFQHGGMPVELSLKYLRQILIPLAWMHTLDSGPVVHADLKPENVLLMKEDDVVLTDFGLATRLPIVPMGGTILYQALENLVQADSGTQADIYSVGVMWYEMLTGSNPFKDVGLEAIAAGDHQALIRAHVEARKWPIQSMEKVAPGQEAQRIPPASEINDELKEHPQLEAMLNRCLASRSSQRYPNARLLLTDVEKYIKTGSVPGLAASVGPDQTEKGEKIALGERTSEMLVEDARVLLGKGEHAEALKLAERLLQRGDPQFLPAILVQARALVAGGQIDKAKEVCRKAQSLAPREPDVFGTMADVYEAAGQPGMANSFRQQEKSLRQSVGSRGSRRI